MKYFKVMREVLRDDLKEQLDSQGFNEELDRAIDAILSDAGSVTLTWPIDVSPKMAKLLRAFAEVEK